MALLDFTRFGVSKEDVKNGKYSYIIGFDLGDGEISAAYWDLADPGFVKPEDLIFDNGDNKKLLSGFFVDENGKKILGTPMSLSNLIDAKGDLFINFKIPPRRLAQGERYENTQHTNLELMQTLLSEALKMIHSKSLPSKFHNPDGSRKKGLLAVGCPSSQEWLAEGTDTEYAKMLTQALADSPLDLKVVIMPESRASLVKVYKEFDIKNKMKNGVVVIDHGSSTLDVTIIDFRRNTSQDFSIPLGAKKIEREMLMAVLKERGRRLADVMSPLFHRLQFRGAKEAYFSNPLGSPRCSIEYKDGDYYGFKFNASTMSDVIHKFPTSFSTPIDGTVKGSWSELHRAFIHNCLKMAGENFDPGSFNGIVMLTGGASKMQFVEDTVKNIFLSSKSKEEIEEANGPSAMDTFPCAVIVKDPEPSYCVSRGLAWAANTDLKAISLIDQVKSDIASTVNADFPELKILIANNIAPMIYDYMLGRVEQWKNNGDKVTLKDMVKKAEADFIDTSTAEGRDRRERMSMKVKDAIRQYLGNSSSSGLKSKVVQAVNDTFSQIFPGEIDTKQISGFQIDEDDWKEIVSKVSSGQVEFSSSILSGLDLENAFVSIFKCIVGIISVVGTLALTVLTLGGINGTKGIDAIDRALDNSNKCFPRDKREKIYNKYKQEREANINKIAAQLMDSNTTAQSREEMSRQIVKILEPAVDKAVNVVSVYF